MNALPPRLVVEIPPDGRLEIGFERRARAPAELRLRLRAVDGVAMIVAGPIGDELDQPVVATVAVGQQTIQGGADRAHDIDVATLRSRAQEIGFAGPAAQRYLDEAAGMIVDKDP